MNVNPKLMSEVQIMKSIIEYILEVKSTFRILGKRHSIAKSTLNRYAHMTKMLDSRIFDLYKIKAKYNKDKFHGVPGISYNLKPDLKEHLMNVKNRLAHMKNSPESWTDFLWKDYIK